MLARTRIELRLAAALLALLPWISHATPAATPAAEADARVNSVARVLAGMEPTYPAHADLVRSDDWRMHRDTVTSGWAKVKQGRGAAMARWRDGAIGSDQCPAGGTLLYPFSGPDFANAFVLFPRCKTYVLFGLETPGEVPDIERMNAQAFGQLLRDVRTAVGDLVERNYFITSHMSKQLHTSRLRGVVPVIIASMSLAGVTVRSVQKLELPALQPKTAEGDVPPAPKPKAMLTRLRGVTITFQRPDSTEVQTLNYFALDATDNGLAHYPEFLPYVRSFKPATMLIKSASYLMHSREFRQMRDALLDAAEFLVQDDTGMPYDVLRTQGWDVRLFGTYARPIPPFQGNFQSSLDKAYKATPPGELPFPFSYHWRQGASNAMIARRGTARLASETPAPVPAVPR